MSKNKRRNLQALITVTILTSSVTFGLTSCSSDKEEEASNKKIESLKNFNKNSTTTSTLVLSESEKKQLQNQSLTILKDASVKGDFDSTNPEFYISEKYELILGSDSSTLIPVGELSNAENSDLDLDGFNVITSEANKIAVALVTGNNNKTQVYIDYINSREDKNICENFTILGSGAISLPITNQNWYKAFVVYEADCPSFPAESGAVEKQKGQVEIFFNISNGQLKPVLSTDLPRS